MSKSRNASRETRSPTHARPLGAELVALVFCLGALIGTLGLVLLMYRNGPIPAEEGPIEALVEASPAPEPPPVVAPPKPPDPIVIMPGQVNLTVDRVDEIRKSQAEFLRHREDLETRLTLLESALSSTEEQARSLSSAIAERRRLADLFQAEAEHLATESELLGMEVDVLERQRVEMEEELRRAQTQPGFAVLPYKGPSGTWRRPIPVLCDDNQASLPPGGPTFSMDDLSPIQGPGRPFVTAIIRLAARLQVAGAPDGSEVIPYVLFVVRPDGIRPFYEARNRVEALGIAYGYELVEEDLSIEFPELDDPSIWGEIERPGPMAGATNPEEAGTREFPKLAQPGGLGPGGYPPSSGMSRFPPEPPAPGSINSPRSLQELLADDPTLRDALAGPPLAGTGDAPVPLASGIGSESLPDSGHAAPARPGGLGARGRSLPDVGGMGSSPIGSTDVQLPPAFDALLASMPERLRAGMAERLMSRLAERGASSEGAKSPATGSSHPPNLGSAAHAEGSQENGRLLPLTGTSGAPPAGLVRPASGGPGLPLAQEEGASPGMTPPAAGETGPPSAGSPIQAIEIVIACNAKGLVVHPGGYRFDEKMLKNEPARFGQTLRRLIASPAVAPSGTQVWPQVRFLIEPRGEKLYWQARRLITTDFPEWPTTWQVAEPRPFSLFGPDRW